MTQNINFSSLQTTDQVRGQQKCIRAVTEILKNSCQEWWVEGGLKNVENQCNFSLSAEVNAT